MFSTRMQAIDLLRHLAAYNLWANTRFVERLAKEPDEVLDRHVESSFPSLRSTLMHIRNAENTWWCRIHDVPFQWPAEANERPENLLVYSKRLKDHVQGCNAGDMERTIVYADLRGNRHEQAQWEILLHCFNHSTQHRGQLITMMRALALGDIPANDLVVHQRALRNGN
jgi:uncharacterized damage-inducible protein DinB